MRKYLFLCLILLLFATSCVEPFEEVQFNQGKDIDISLLSKKVWKVINFKTAEANHVSFLETAFVQFNEDFTVNIITETADIYPGTWAIASDKSYLAVRMENRETAYGQFEDEWVLTISDNQTVTFTERSAEAFELFTLEEYVLEDLPTYCSEFGEISKNDRWYITYFERNGTEESKSFDDLSFEFDNEFHFDIFSSTENYKEIWASNQDCGAFKFWVNDNFELGEISSKWEIKSVDNDRLRLVRDGLNGIDEIHFTKGKTKGPNQCPIIVDSFGKEEWIVLNAFQKGKVSLTGLLGASLTMSANGDFLFGSNAVGEWTVDDNCQSIKISTASGPFKEYSQSQFEVIEDAEGLTLIDCSNDIKIFLVSKQYVAPSCVENILQLQQNPWKVNNVEGSLSYDNLVLEFKEQGVLEVINEGLTSKGSYQLLSGCSRMKLVFDDLAINTNLGGYYNYETSGLDFVLDNCLATTTFDLVKGDILINPCDKTTTLLSQTHSTWRISSFLHNSISTISEKNFEQHRFKFIAGSVLEVSTNEVTYQGVWELLNECATLRLDITDGDDLMDFIDHKWLILSSSDSEVVLRYQLNSNNEIIDLTLMPL